jgi:hypothetical protein
VPRRQDLGVGERGAAVLGQRLALARDTLIRGGRAAASKTISCVRDPQCARRMIPLDIGRQRRDQFAPPRSRV